MPQPFARSLSSLQQPPDRILETTNLADVSFTNTHSHTHHTDTQSHSCTSAHSSSYLECYIRHKLSDTRRSSSSSNIRSSKCLCLQWGISQTDRQTKIIASTGDTSLYSSGCCIIFRCRQSVCVFVCVCVMPTSYREEQSSLSKACLKKTRKVASTAACLPARQPASLPACQAGNRTFNRKTACTRCLHLY